MSRRWIVALVVVSLTLFTGRVWGQDKDRVEWRGLVVDPARRPVADADVTATPQGKGEPQWDVTDGDGRFRFFSPRGLYRVKAAHEFFTEAEAEVSVTYHTFSPPLHLGPLPPIEVQPYWNTWATDPSGEPTATLLEHSTYIVHFDLAGASYQQVLDNPTLTAQLGPELEEELKSLGQKLPLLVTPFVQGEVLSLAEEAPQPAETQLLRIGPLLNTANYLNRREEAGPVRDRLPRLSENLAAVSASVTVRTGGPGEGLVGLAIWDAQTRQPLDFAALDVIVVHRGSQPVVPPPAIQVASGVRPLRGSPSAPPVDASVGIFERGTIGDLSFHNTVVFRNSRGAHWWNPRRSIRDYVNLEGQFGLARQLELARCSGDFEQIGEFFSGVVFSAPDPRGRREAQDSRDALNDLISRHLYEEWAKRPVIATLFLNRASGPLPMPLGLLGVRDDRTGGSISLAHRLGQVAVITQPLPVPRRIAAGGPCIDFITTVLPKTLGLGDHCDCEAFDRLLKPTVPPDPRYLIQEFSDFQKYLEPTHAPRKLEGLLLIAHHADGFMSLDPSFYPALQAESITRRYDPGSAAILVGCTVGSLAPLNRNLPFLRTLNEHGVDAMVFSPFTLDAALGSRLAVHFSDEIENVRNDKQQKPITLRELYYRVLDSMEKDKDAKPFLDELSELTLGGSGDIALCPEPPPQHAPMRIRAEAPARQCTCGLLDLLGRSMKRRGVLSGPPGTSSSTGPVKSDIGPGRCLEGKP